MSRVYEDLVNRSADGLEDANRIEPGLARRCGYGESAMAQGAGDELIA